MIEYNIGKHNIQQYTTMTLNFPCFLISHNCRELGKTNVMGYHFRRLPSLLLPPSHTCT
jgi:hypothetical protein